MENLDITDDYDPAEDYSADAAEGVDVGGLMSPWTARDVANIYGVDLPEVLDFLGDDWDPDTALTVAEVELLDLAWINAKERG